MPGRAATVSRGTLLGGRSSVTAGVNGAGAAAVPAGAVLAGALTMGAAATAGAAGRDAAMRCVSRRSKYAMVDADGSGTSPIAALGNTGPRAPANCMLAFLRSK